MRTLVLAHFTFHEALRRRTVTAAALLTLLFLGLFTFGTHFAVRELETSVLIIPSAKPLLISQLLLTVLASSWFPSLATSIGVFIAHAIAMAAGVEEQLGFVLKNETMQNAGVWVSLVIPSDAMEKLAAAALQNTTGATLALPGPF